MIRLRYLGGLIHHYYTPKGAGMNGELKKI